jgi:hypothetical protein
MGDQVNETSALRRVLWPERRPVSEVERDQVALRISETHASGRLSDEQATQWRSRLFAVRTRGELRVVVDGLPRAAPSNSVAALRVVTWIWLLVNLLQVVIWAAASVIGQHFVNPWWLWTLAVGGVVVGGLWWFAGSRKSK